MVGCNKKIKKEMQIKHSFSKFEHELARCASFAMEGGTGGNVNVGL